MIEIRQATIADARMLAELRWEFRTKRDAPTESHDAFVRRCTAWMRRELPTGTSWKVWVAVQDHVIAGQVWVHTVQKIPNPIAEAESLAYVSNLFVKESARGGTGSRLLEQAVTWCRKNHIDRVVLWPTKRSVSLYLSQGFSHGGDVMELKV